MRISLKVDELLPLVTKYLKDKYGLNDNVKLTCSSKTTFLTFDAEE